MLSRDPCPFRSVIRSERTFHNQDMPRGSNSHLLHINSKRLLIGPDTLNELIFKVNGFVCRPRRARFAFARPDSDWNRPGSLGHSTSTFSAGRESEQLNKSSEEGIASIMDTISNAFAYDQLSTY